MLMSVRREWAWSLGVGVWATGVCGVWWWSLLLLRVAPCHPLSWHSASPVWDHGLLPRATKGEWLKTIR